MVWISRRFCLAIPIALIFWACAAGPQGEMAKDSANPSLDGTFGRLLANGKFEQARSIAESLLTSTHRTDREVAAYWTVIIWLHQDKLDSAMTLLESYRGKWSGGMRRVHTEAFLNMAKKVKENRLAMLQVNLEHQHKHVPDKSQQDRVEYLQREAVELRAEVGRLQTERLKYQKLIKDLETIR